MRESPSAPPPWRRQRSASFGRVLTNGRSTSTNGRPTTGRAQTTLAGSTVRPGHPFIRSQKLATKRLSNLSQRPPEPHEDHEEARRELDILRKALTTSHDENNRLKDEMRQLSDEVMIRPDTSLATARSTGTAGQKTPAPGIDNPILKGDRWQLLTGDAAKQKMYRMQQSSREKDRQLRRLQAEMKTTNLSELRQQLDVYHKEILRLRHQLETYCQTDKVPDGTDYAHLSKNELCARLTTVKDALVRQNEVNSQLKMDNATLRAKLENGDEDGADRTPVPGECRIYVTS